MNAVERVQAAIDKLTAERDAGTLERWDLFRHVFGIIANKTTVAEYSHREDAALTVTMHSTINPLLATLERWLEYRPRQMEEPIVALADAILGADS